MSISALAPCDLKEGFFFFYNHPHHCVIILKRCGGGIKKKKTVLLQLQFASRTPAQGWTNLLWKEKVEVTQVYTRGCGGVKRIHVQSIEVNKIYNSQKLCTLLGLPVSISCFQSPTSEPSFIGLLRVLSHSSPSDRRLVWQRMGCFDSIQ